MLLLRPVRLNDHAEILNLAQMAGIGMTSLPPDAYILERKIARAVASFNGSPDYPQNEVFLFALEDSDTGRIAGTTGIAAHVGIQKPFYSYKLSTIVQASEALNVYSLNHVLHMVNDYTGATELGSLFLTPDYRRDGIGKFLSRSRHLMLAEFPHLFSDMVISEIRGVQNKRGESPFYNQLARHFFQMDFQRCDFVYATQGGQFIADLMPRYPIYVKLLAEEAQEVIGRPLEASLPAKRMLEEEGFTHEGYIDIFDAGPTLQCERDQIRSVRESQKLVVRDVVSQLDGAHHMLCNSTLADFRILRAPVAIDAGEVVITTEAAEHLRIKRGDVVRIVL